MEGEETAIETGKALAMAEDIKEDIKEVEEVIEEIKSESKWTDEALQNLSNDLFALRSRVDALEYVEELEETEAVEVIPETEEAAQEEETIIEGAEAPEIKEIIETSGKKKKYIFGVI